MPTVEAETALEAVAKLVKAGKLPAAGEQFWLQIVLGSEGTTAKALSVPLMPVFEIPMVWQPQDEVSL